MRPEPLEEGVGGSGQQPRRLGCGGVGRTQWSVERLVSWLNPLCTQHRVGYAYSLTHPPKHTHTHTHTQREWPGGWRTGACG